VPDKREESGELERVTLARHQLSTGVYRLAADCERLWADLHRPTQRAWREHAGRALVQARFLLTLIAGPAGGGQILDSRALEQLNSELRAPLKEVTDALTRLLAMIPTDLEEELVLQDARRARGRRRTTGRRRVPCRDAAAGRCGGRADGSGRGACTGGGRR
jgi:hypothetical protein